MTKNIQTSKNRSSKTMTIFRSKATQHLRLGPKAKPLSTSRIGTISKHRKESIRTAEPHASKSYEFLKPVDSFFFFFSFLPSFLPSFSFSLSLSLSVFLLSVFVSCCLSYSMSFFISCCFPAFPDTWRAGGVARSNWSLMVSPSSEFSRTQICPHCFNWGPASSQRPINLTIFRCTTCNLCCWWASSVQASQP